MENSPASIFSESISKSDLMNICLLSYRGNMFCGGQGIYLYYLSRALAQRGHNITIIVGPPYPAYMPWAKVHREVNHHFWGWHRDWLPKPNPFEAFIPLNMLELAYRKFGFFPEPMAFSLRAFRTFGKLCRQTSFDVVHDIQSLGFGLIAVKLSGVPVVTTVHHPLTVDLRASINQPGKNFVDVMGSIEFYPVLMQAFVARRLDAVLTSSKASKKELIADFRIKADKIRIVGNGIELEHFNELPYVKRSNNLLLFVGYVDGPQKGFYYLLKALKLLPKHIELIAVDDPNRFWAPMWIKELGLENRVKFTGKVSDEELLKLYSQSTITVISSLYEGFGLPAVEALCCGSAVVATRTGALPEIIEHGVTGLLVPPKDPQAIAEAVMYFLLNEDARLASVKEGRNRVAQNFSWEKIAEKTEAVYKEVISNKEKYAHY